AQIERIARRAFELARDRRSFVTSVDKANVLETSRLWREVVSGLADEYPDVRLEHMLVDNAGLQLVLDPSQFDVILTENTFGDILSDVAAGSCGGLGVAASVSLGDRPPGIFEPVHGTAPDIAGQGIANPAAAFRSVALLLRAASPTACCRSRTPWPVPSRRRTTSSTTLRSRSSPRRPWRFATTSSRAGPSRRARSVLFAPTPSHSSNAGSSSGGLMEFERSPRPRPPMPPHRSPGRARPGKPRSRASGPPRSTVYR